MLYGFLILIACQLLGDIIAKGFGLLIPGPVIGMLILFAGLLVKKGVPACLNDASNGILKYIALIFVPAGAGVSMYLALIAQEWIVILIAGVGSTIITLVVCGWLFQIFDRKETGVQK